MAGCACALPISIPSMINSEQVLLSSSAVDGGVYSQYVLVVDFPSTSRMIANPLDVLPWRAKNPSGLTPTETCESPSVSTTTEMERSSAFCFCRVEVGRRKRQKEEKQKETDGQIGSHLIRSEQCDGTTSVRQVTAAPLSFRDTSAYLHLRSSMSSSCSRCFCKASRRSR